MSLQPLFYFLECGHTMLERNDHHWLIQDFHCSLHSRFFVTKMKLGNVIYETNLGGEITQ